MYGFLLQDWTTIRLNFASTSITQSESNWVSLQPYQDIVIWLEVKEASLATGVTGLIFNYETSPLKDESLFTAMTTSSSITGAISTPDIKKVILATNPTVPLARWVRWRLAAASGTAGVSDVTFRIAAAANAVSSLA